MFKHGDLIEPSPGNEVMANRCRGPHTFEGYMQDGDGLLTDFVCNQNEHHSSEYWQLVPVNTPALQRRIGDWSHVPAERLTDPITGANKGMRVTRMDLIPPEALMEIGAVYGFGERKYPAGPDGPNWLRGMPYSWNLRALKDHIAEWELGKDYDDEDGVSPLAHAAWHLLSLLTYQARGLGTDDRPFKR